MSGILEGIRVLDWTQWQQGSLAASLLGDLGADVIKIERKGVGDGGRGTKVMHGYIKCTLSGGRNWFFETFNRNKRGLAIDMSKPTGKEIIYRLVKKADVFLHNSRFGVAERQGMGYDTLSQYNPRLIYAYCSGYGSAGPDASRPGMDYSTQGRTGLLWTWGEPGDPPYWGVGGPSDQVGAFMGAYGVMGALLARERTGVGQKIETSLLNSTMWLQGSSMGCQLYSGQPWSRYSRKHCTNAMWNHYQCKDGKWLVLSMVVEQYWRPLTAAIGTPELADDPRYSTAEARATNGTELVALFDKVFATRTLKEWEEILVKSPDLLFDRVQTTADLADDPQVVANNYIMDYDHPTLGKVKVLNYPVAFGKTPANVRMPAPELGQHTEEILTELCGYSWEEVSSLRDEGVI